MAMSTRIWNQMRGRLNRLSFVICHLSYSAVCVSAFSAVGALLLTACTIIDNDLRDLPDTPGFKEAVHVENELYTLDYQYNPGTMVYDDHAQPYIHGIDYDNNILYLEEYTPDEYLPTVGSVLSAPSTEKLKYGLRDRAIEVTREGPLYAIRLESATLTEVYKHLHLDTNFGNDTTDVDDTDVIDDLDASDSRSLTRAADAKTFDVGAGQWHTFNVFDAINALLIAKGIPSAPNHLKLDTSGKMEGPLKGYADLEGDVTVKWRPVIMGQALIDTDNEVVDINLSTGVEYETTVDVTGKIGLEVDVVELLNLKEALTAEKLVVPELALWVTVGLNLTFDINVSGTFSKTFHRKSYLTFGGRHGVSGKADGTYIDKHRGTTQETDPVSKITEKYSDDADINCSIETSLMLGPELKLLLGNPRNYPQVGISLTGGIGPKLSTKLIAKQQYAYDKSLVMGIGVQLSGTFFFNLFPGLTLDWDFVDALAKYLGAKDGAQVMLPAFSVEKRFYPDIRALSIRCDNEAETEYPPTFSMSFNVTERGIIPSNSSTIRPHFKVFPKGAPDDSEPLLKYDPEKALPPYGTDPNTRFSWERFGKGVLERGVEYEMEITMCTHFLIDGLKWTRVLWKQRFPFAVGFDPSMRFHGSFITAQWRYVPYNEMAILHDDKTRYDWTFRTVMSFNETSRLVGWGFRVCNKDFYVSDVIPEKGVTFPIRWKVKGSSRDKRSPLFDPYLDIKNAITGKVERKDQKIFSVDLDFDPDSWQNTREDEYYFINDRTYLITGFDIDDEFTVPEQVNIDKQGAFSSRQKGRLVTDPDGTQVVEFTIDLDDL